MTSNCKEFQLLSPGRARRDKAPLLGDKLDAGAPGLDLPAVNSTARATCPGAAIRYASCSSTIRTAGSQTSGENLLAVLLVMAAIL